MALFRTYPSFILTSTSLGMATQFDMFIGKLTMFSNHLFPRRHYQLFSLNCMASRVFTGNNKHYKHMFPM